jgi:hypothetical protein
MDENLTMNTAAAEAVGETAENAAASAEVVASQEETASATEQQATVENNQGSIEGGKPAQNRGKNAQMKDYRLKAEAYDGMSNGILAYARSQGLQPVDAAQALKMLEAKSKGVSLEEHLQAESKAAAEQEAMVRNHPLFKEMEQRAAQNDAVAARYNAEQQMQADLEAIRTVDPSINSLEEIEGYTEMVKEGLTGLNAYYALKGRDAIKAAATPPAVGAVGAAGNTDRDFTSEELDRLTDDDLKDENVFKRAVRSMSKLK